MNINTNYYFGAQVCETKQQTMRRTPLPTYTPSMTVAQARAHSQIDQFQGKVLRERPPIISSSQEESMIDKYVDQNALLWKRIEGYEQKIEELNQTNNDLQKQYRVHAKRLDNYNQQNLELKQQYDTLTKESRKRSDQGRSLSSQLVMLQFANSNLASTLDQAGMSISYIHTNNRKQQIMEEVKNRQTIVDVKQKRLVKQQDSLLDSIIPQDCNEKMNYKQFRSQQGSMNHSDRNIADGTIHLNRMCKIISQQHQESSAAWYAATINSKRNDIKLKHALPKFSKIMNKKRKISQKRRLSSLTIISQNKLSPKEEKECNNREERKFEIEDGSEDSDDDDNILVF